MQNKKKIHPKIKSQLHPRNRHRERYDFNVLIKSSPALAEYVAENKFGDESVDFFDPKAVKALNEAILKHYYGLQYWDIPAGYLCPPIPGRADYIHYMADLLADNNGGKIPKGNKIKCLDIGVGANCVYPIVANHEYGWSFVGSDIEHKALQSAAKIIENKAALKRSVTLRRQSNASSIFKGVIEENERFDLTICNPPFHSSKAEAQAGSTRKLKNLKATKEQSKLNFGGQSNELWCAGGEEAFARKMINESRTFASSCRWFSTLISKHEHLESLYQALEKVGAKEVKTIPMGQGNKMSRIVAWTFQ